jgi:hypothetical protein
MKRNTTHTRVAKRRGQADFWKELAIHLGNYGRMLESTGLVFRQGDEMAYRNPPEEARTRAAGKVLTGFAYAIEQSLPPKSGKPQRVPRKQKKS